MRSVSLSHNFAKRDRVPMTQVESMLRSHGLIATNGRNLGGGPLAPEIARCIEDADALVALLTIRENDPGNVTNPWVIQELGRARLKEALAGGASRSGAPPGRVSRDL